MAAVVPVLDPLSVEVEGLEPPESAPVGPVAPVDDPELGSVTPEPPVVPVPWPLPVLPLPEPGSEAVPVDPVEPVAPEAAVVEPVVTASLGV